MSAADALPGSSPPPAVRATSPARVEAPEPRGRRDSRLPAGRQLAVRFAPDRAGRTYVAAQRATHPYHLCRALYRGDDPPGLCTLYVQGCSGGLFEGDRVRSAFSIDGVAQAHVTTGAATIVHRMPDSGWAEQQVSVNVAAGALLELMPDPFILFPGSRLRSRLDLHLERGARALVVDSFLTHRLPGDHRPFLYLDNETRIEDGAGRLLARDRSRATGLGLAEEGRWRGQATVMVMGPGAADALSLLRAAIAPAPAPTAAPAAAPTVTIYAGASAMPDGVGVLVRLLAADGVALRAGVRACWTAARRAFGLPAGEARPK